MTRAELISMAMSRMDEIVAFDENTILAISPAPAKPAREYCDKVLNEAISSALKLCSFSYIKNDQTANLNALSGIFTIPDNALRFLYVTYSGGIITEFVAENNPLHLQQKHTFTAATASKPVAVICNSQGKIEIYPNTLSNAVLTIVKTLSSDWSNTISICTDELLSPIAWETAGKALLIMGDQRATNAFEMAKQQIKLLNY